MPALNPDNTSTLPGYSLPFDPLYISNIIIHSVGYLLFYVGYKISFSDTPLDAKQVSNTLPSRTKKPSKMPGTRGYIKNKDSADNPTRMV